MSRRRRLRLPDHTMHVVHRGNNRQRIFFGEKDHWSYLFQLAEWAPKTNCDVHAYVLMPNHVHLLLTPREWGAASALMKRLGQHHAQYVNRQHRRTGGLWEGRFYSAIVHTELYLLRCYRYVELNPVRADLAPHASAYPWSSHMINGLGAPSSLITPHEEFLRLGRTDRERRENYVALFEQGLDATTLGEIREGMRAGILGSDEFKNRIRGQTPAEGQTPPGGQTPARGLTPN